MPALHELQSAFLRALLGPDELQSAQAEALAKSRNLKCHFRGKRQVSRAVLKPQSGLWRPGLTVLRARMAVEQARTARRSTT